MSPAETVRLSVVIAARDAERTIGEQLDALLAQSTPVPWEVVVVDDGSHDGTAAAVQRRISAHPRLRLVTGPGRGVSAARNAGVSASVGSVVAMVDADDVVAEGWLPAMTRALEDAELVAGRLELERLNPPEVIGSRGRAIADGPGRFGGALAFAHSCNVGFSRRAFDAVGGFDPTLAAGEDVDLSLRMHAIGVEVHDAPDAVVHYRYRTDARSLFGQARSYARVAPRIERRARAAGIPVQAGSSSRDALWLVRHLPRLAHADGRADWVTVAGRAVGRIEGARAARRSP